MSYLEEGYRAAGESDQDWTDTFCDTWEDNSEYKWHASEEWMDA